MAADQWKAAFLAVCLRRLMSELKWVEYQSEPWNPWKHSYFRALSEPSLTTSEIFRKKMRSDHFKTTSSCVCVSFSMKILVRAACWPWHAALASDFQPLTELLAKDDRCHGIPFLDLAVPVVEKNMNQLRQLRPVARSIGINEASIDWEGVFLTPLCGPRQAASSALSPLGIVG